MRLLHLDSRDSAWIVVREVLVFWEKARIPTRLEKHCIDKLIGIYNDWDKIRKNKLRINEAQKAKEKGFIDSLEDLFDIAHSNALEKMTIQEDKEFLAKQREKGRPGSMVGVDAVLAAIEKRKAERSAQEQQRKEKHYSEMKQENGN